MDGQPLAARGIEQQQIGARQILDVHGYACIVNYRCALVFVSEAGRARQP